MIERIIENWLTKSSERSYQLPFCYLLMQEGKTIIHLTRHCAMEHGKDIIAVDENGNVHAYQLKGVNGVRLKLSDWKEIQSQIFQLTNTPCSHPSIHSNEYHKSYLVVNGDIDEEVQHAITTQNNDWEKRGYPEYKLEVIVKGQILKMAFKVKEQFIPSEVSDFKSLLEFYLEDGIGFLDKGKFASLLIKMTDTKVLKSKNELRRLTTSTALLCSLATTSYSNKNNHVAVIEAWTIYIATILRLQEKFDDKLKSEYPEIDLANKIIITSLINLFEEIKDRNDFLDYSPPTDVFVFRHRTTIILGMIAYLGTISNEISANDIDEIIKKQFSNAMIWGESAIPFFISIYFFYIKNNKKDFGLSLLVSFVQTTIKAFFNDEIPFYDIYTSAEDSVIIQFSNELESNHVSQVSYVVETLLILSSQPELRNLVAEIWPNITRCIFCEFQFVNKSDFYLWRIEDGEEVSRHPDLTKSWKELIAESQKFNSDKIPESIKIYSFFLPLFLMVYPHRLNPEVLKWFINSPAA